MMGRIGAALCVLHVLLLGAAQCSSSTIKIRGLDPSLAEHYKPQGDKFKCLDGDKIIMYSLINDDFCDCFDGSDEPGTTSVLFLAAAWLEGADQGAFVRGHCTSSESHQPQGLGLLHICVRVHAYAKVYNNHDHEVSGAAQVHRPVCMANSTAKTEGTRHSC